nr:MAG TPA: hypothetical protein [Caudoviricetes sp.]
MLHFSCSEIMSGNHLHTTPRFLVSYIKKSWKLTRKKLPERC